MAVAVQTPVFEGPFDLLLHLILSEEVDLYEVRLHDIVDAYLAELDAILDQGRVDLESTTEFLQIAATLVELKTRRLLPRSDDADPDEDLWLWEQRDLLLARLIESRTFKGVARRLEEQFEIASRSAPRVAGLEERFYGLSPQLLAGVTPSDLARAFARATRPRPVPVVSLAHVTPIRASVADALAELGRTLPGGGPRTFRELTAHVDERVEVVVRFLAVLELCKEGLVELEQTVSFGDLLVRWVGPADGIDVDAVMAGVDEA